MGETRYQQLCQASQHSAFWKSGQVKELALQHTHHIVAAEPAEISFWASCHLPRIQDRSPRNHSIYSLRYNHSWLRILPFDTTNDRCWGASLVAQLVMNLPATQETWVQSLGREDPLEQEVATHSSILAWKNPMNRGAWGPIVHRVTKSQTRLSTHALGEE